MFVGIWKNVSSQYAGLFFRVEGGNAANFGNDQEQSVQPHQHTYLRADGTLNSVNEGDGRGAVIREFNGSYNSDTGSTGNTETRPKNTTIRVPCVCLHCIIKIYSYGITRIGFNKNSLCPVAHKRPDKYIKKPVSVRAQRPGVFPKEKIELD